MGMSGFLPMEVYLSLLMMAQAFSYGKTTNAARPRFDDLRRIVSVNNLELEPIEA